ncbi:hypothetical protein EG329_004905 [Mollisiaceae sp. DMI_Dod_QoI]|nr:hypothetical protein EG329_004905 [Helotiales sp. DMI_Dod_QoI]
MAQERTDAVANGFTIPTQTDTYAEDHNSGELGDPSLRMNPQPEIRNRGAGWRHGPTEGNNLSPPTGNISSEAAQVIDQTGRPRPNTTQSSSRLTPQSATLHQTRTEYLLADRNHGFDRLIPKNINEYPTGLPRLAGFINSSDHNAVFRRFGRISARLLVQLEIDLTDLERELDNLDKKDASSPLVEPRLRGFERFPEDDGSQREVLEKIHKKICEYFEVLLYESQVRALEKAPPRHHLGLFTWMRNRKPLGDERDDFIFHLEDFVSVAKQSEKGTRIADLLESFVTWCPNPITKYILQTERERSKVEDDYVDQYSVKRVSIFNRVIAVFLAICILLIPVMLLFLVEMSKQAMAWIVFVFVLAFCCMVTVTTEAKVQDIFISTAAYAAVLVTFLGNLNHS